MKHGPTHTHDSTLANAIGAAVERVEYWLGVGDDVMAAVCAAVVRKLLSHPCAPLYADSLTWRREVKRWDRVRVRVGAAPMMLSDYAEHLAGVLLVEATRRAERAASH